MPQALSLTLFIGQTTPRPVPTLLSEAVESLEIVQTDAGRSGFQIVFRVGRSQPADLQDDPVLTNSLLQPFNRVIVTVTLDARVHVLMDGIITYLEFAPSLEPGDSLFTVTGEDVSVMMDLEEKSIEHPAQNEKDIVSKLIAAYSRYGLVPKLGTPAVSDRPQTTERVPVQLGTDLAYIQELADRYAFLFYVTPGPTVGQNTAYWGPPERKGTPLKPLTVNMGSATNVESINFQYDALAVTQVAGQVQDRKTNQIQPVMQSSSTRTPLSRSAAINAAHIRTTQFRETARLKTYADARAQALLDRSTDRVLTVTGQLDTLVYGSLLERGKLVDVRGVGYTYDGAYYINQVVHSIREGEYKQRFQLSREGLETMVSRVNV